MSFIYQTSCHDQHQLLSQLETVISPLYTAQQKIIWQLFNLDEKLKIEAVRQLQKQILQIKRPETIVFFVLNLNQAQLVVQNALLKILEEPPTGVDFIILSPNPGLLLPTILSRCSFLSLNHSDKILQNQLDLSILDSFWQISSWKKSASTQLASTLNKNFDTQFKQLDPEINLLKNDYASQIFQQFLDNLIIILDQKQYSQFNFTLKELAKIITLTKQSLIYLRSNVSPKNVFYYLLLNFSSLSFF